MKEYVCYKGSFPLESCSFMSKETHQSTGHTKPRIQTSSFVQLGVNKVAINCIIYSPFSKFGGMRLSYSIRSACRKSVL